MFRSLFFAAFLLAGIICRAPDPLTDIIATAHRSFCRRQREQAHQLLKFRSWQHNAEPRREFNHAERAYFKHNQQGILNWLPFVPTVSCPDEERVGDPIDGAKWICGVNRLPTDCVIYSFGSHGQFDFEEGMHKLAPQCDIHTFDGDQYSSSPHTHYHQMWLGAGDSDVVRGTRRWKPYQPGQRESFAKLLQSVSSSRESSKTRTTRQRSRKKNNIPPLRSWLEFMDKTFPGPAPSRTLQSMTRLINSSHIDILKIDIEGSEFVTVPFFFNFSHRQPGGHYGPVPIGQIQIEVHSPFAVATAPNLRRLFFSFFGSMFDAGFHLFHVETNPFATSCAEFALIHHSSLPPYLAKPCPRL
eukprot:NODE_754_length_1366_cov_441.156416_g569_i0.p1 GENE.NODE_754_length_1366_cov_441.156416_g569_i0~~NODE_754_length_1366_cov_441.156416_g569_i0.p1  ORF type:complete len:382 (-),score=60.24 NODE_754_length_1366_cov_441.156416_g569_i0:221-1291(-)